MKGHASPLLGILLVLAPWQYQNDSTSTIKVADAALACTTTDYCVNTLREGSQCIDGECTNPYHKGGCLQQRLVDWKKTRVCHSEDPPEAELLGFCVPPDPDFDYMEIRIATQNWESAFFQVWVIQIVLSEVLGIPVTLESGTREDLVDFYHPRSPLGYGLSYDYDALRRGNEIVDCRLVKKENEENDNYQSCAHVLNEIWYGQQSELDKLLEEGTIVRPSVTGALGYQGLNIPIFTGAKDPTLLTHLGLAGEENRVKLANTFKRPTNWKDYCDEVSPDNCATPDAVAVRPPRSDLGPEHEESRYYLEGLFNGHFRATWRNDCATYPLNCTGHVVDYPCGWNSFLQQQFHHLGIALESNGDEPLSNGYSYAAMTEIWAAANATKSDVMMRWWTPEALYQTFLGTDAEFQRVSLRPPTDDCLKARVDSRDRCNANISLEGRLGKAEGSCDEPPFSLQRIFTKSLADMSEDPAVPAEMRSPGYETIDNIRMTGLQIGKIFDHWLKRNSDKYNFDPRDAACRWVAENFDEVILPMVPRTYPRVVEEKDDLQNTIRYRLSWGFSILSALCVTFAITGTIVCREKRAIQMAQVDFMYLLLFGLSMVSLSAIILNLPPTDFTCMAIGWLVIQGYTFELVPLLFKVAAISSLVSASKKFKRVQLDKKKLYLGVLVISVAVTIFLILWTVLDPSKSTSEFILTEEESSLGETIVIRAYYCSSESDIWLFISVGWHALLLLCGTVLAVQSRKLKRDNVTECLVVAILVYSHFMFVVLRMLHYNFSDVFYVWNLAPYLSLIFSCDVIAACCIYFFPKILSESITENVRSTFPGAITTGSASNHATKGVISSTSRKENSTVPNDAQNGDRDGPMHPIPLLSRRNLLKFEDENGDGPIHPSPLNECMFADSDEDSNSDDPKVYHYDSRSAKEKLMDSQNAIMNSGFRESMMDSSFSFTARMNDDSFLMSDHSGRRSTSLEHKLPLLGLEESDREEADDNEEDILFVESSGNGIEESKSPRQSPDVDVDEIFRDEDMLDDAAENECSKYNESAVSFLGFGSASGSAGSTGFLRMLRERMEDELLPGEKKKDETEVSV